MVDEEVEKVWNEFWVPLLVSDGYNKNMVNMDQIKKELYDYYIVMGEVSKVYNRITNGKFSKPNTKAEHIIEATEENYEYLYS